MSEVTSQTLVKSVYLGAGLRIDIVKYEGITEKYGPFTEFEACLFTEDGSRERIATGSALDYVSLDVQNVEKAMRWALPILIRRATAAVEVALKAPRRKRHA